MIYQHREFEPNEFIVLGADPAEGHDYSTFVAISKKYADVVMISQSKEESSQLGHSLNHIGRWIHKVTGLYPSIAPERNVGTATIVKLKELNYPNIFKMPTSFVGQDQKDSDNFGWHTNTATRPKMLDDLALAIRQGAIKIPSKQIVDEMYSFIRHHKTGKPQADTSSHDDLVMALAIAWQLYQIVPQPSSNDYHYATRRDNLNAMERWSIG